MVIEGDLTRVGIPISHGHNWLSKNKKMRVVGAEAMGYNTTMYVAFT